MTEELYRASGALQAELEQDLEGEERPCAIDDWVRCRWLFRYWKSRARAIIEQARVAGCGRTHHMLLHPSTLSEPVRSTEPISEQRGVLAALIARLVSRLCARSRTS
ncbi:hypothetical protein T12_15907 [Trichinella patagoniensis]|uniref:Uncharacterized protein n=1 Tax=Trichinella patagoniensis TaxID=990121 RepID=A0A0V0ZTN1_9BILA|nr:hypothetical protein T12_15907 [Trichinella patagoniensis]